MTSDGRVVLRCWDEREFADFDRVEKAYLALGYGPLLAAERAYEQVPPLRTLVAKNSLTRDNGVNRIWLALTGAAFTPFNAANARVGVGDSTVANPVPNTLNDLQAGANKLRKGMDGGYPTVGASPGATAHQVVFRATFQTAEANWNWNEYAVFNAGAGGDMLDRAVQSFGNKPAGQVWQVQVTVSII